MNLTVRRAELRDIGTLAKNVVAMAFDANAITLDSEVVRQGVQGLFDRPELGFYVVAELDRSIVGSLMIVFEWSDWRNGVHWWIHSVYVSPEHRRKGIYRQMFEYLKGEVRSDSNAVSLNLSVHRDNQRARTAYESLGMKESKQVIYSAPNL